MEEIERNIGIKAKIKLHFTRHIIVNETNYLYLVTALAAGIAAGAFVVGCLDGALKSEIRVIFINYRNALESGGKTAVVNILIDNVLPVLRPLIIVLICGMTPLALLSGIAVLAIKGFSVGFFIAAAVCCLDLKSAALLLVSSAPYQLISAMVLIVAAGVAAAHCRIREKYAVYVAEMTVLAIIAVLSVLLDLYVKCL